MANQKKHRIIFLLDEIKERIEALEEHPQETVNLDIIMEDIRMVYREVELLRFKSLQAANSDFAGMEALVKTETKEATAIDFSEEKEPNNKPDIIERASQDLSEAGQVEPSHAKKDEAIYEIQPQEEIEKPLIPSEVQLAAKEEPIVTDSSKTVQTLHPEKSTLFVADKLKGEDNSIYKKFLSESDDKYIGSRLQSLKIKSIREAVGVNEKFLFINELFSGNIQDYNAAIDKLNNFEDSQGAFNYLNELGNKCSWDFERSENTIRLLVNLVQRRYAKV